MFKELKEGFGRNKKDVVEPRSPVLNPSTICSPLDYLPDSFGFIQGIRIQAEIAISEAVDNRTPIEPLLDPLVEAHLVYTKADAIMSFLPQFPQATQPKV